MSDYKWPELEYEDALYEAFRKDKFERERNDEYLEVFLESFPREKQKELLKKKILDRDEYFLIDCLIDTFDFFRENFEQLLIAALDKNNGVVEYITGQINKDIEELERGFDPEREKIYFDPDKGED